MRKILTVIIAMLALSGVQVAHAAPAGDPPRPRWAERPCEYEDSVNCYWDAGDQGFKGGYSFIVRQIPRTGVVCVFYVDPTYARKHDRCE